MRRFAPEFVDAVIAGTWCARRSIRSRKRLGAGKKVSWQHIFPNNASVTFSIAPRGSRTSCCSARSARGALNLHQDTGDRRPLPLKAKSYFSLNQGCRFPDKSITQTFSIRCVRISDSLADSIQSTKSLRSFAVRSFHCAFAFGREPMAL